MELVMSPKEVSDTDVEPDTESARLSEPAEAVSSTVAAVIVPPVVLVKFPAAVRLKSVPAEEAPETLTSIELETLTNP